MNLHIRIPRTLVSLAVGCLLTGCASSKAKPPIVVLKVDDAHYVSSHENDRPERYAIEPCPGVFLDATGYTFKPNSPVPKGGPADQIEITRLRVEHEQPSANGNFITYQMPWVSGKARYELSSSTLKSANGSLPFSGFKAGERWFIFIGSRYETNELFVVWSGVIQVR